jgi:RNA polymerase sigma-70 factor (ECF subfamily)
MEQLYRLATLFLDQKPKRVTTPDLPALDALLHQAWERARSPWPQFALSDEDFASGLARSLKKTGAEEPFEELLGQLHLSDLYLAFACLREVPAAREALKDCYLSKVPAWLERFKFPKDELDEILQTLLINLLMGTPQARPRLATYTGTGPLNRWIRVIVVHMAFRRVGSLPKPSEENSLAMIEAIPAPHADAEQELILSRNRAEFRRAYLESLSELPEEQKLLLQMYFIKKLTTTQLGALFGVEQSTVWRRLQSVRKAVYEATKQRLKERLHLTSGEFKSVVAAIRSQLDASISQILKE